MGSKHSISNLGYCYLYGRGMEANISLAIAYFKIASMKGDIDASYKLGDIYSSDKWGLKDNEMSVYYYRLAASYIIDDNWSEDNVFWTKKLSKYPSLCFALGRELLSGINMTRDIALSYIVLKHAFDGYTQELMNGAEWYQSSFDNVKALLQDFRYDEVRDRIDKRFANPYDEEDDDFDDEDDNDEIDEVIEDDEF